MHIPFDFTVYEQARTFELRVTKLDGLQTANEIALWYCGRKLSEVTGTVQFSPNRVFIDLEFGLLERRKKLQGDFSIISATEAFRPCKDSQH